MLSALYVALSSLLLIYSYGFTDLNLTLWDNPLAFRFVSWVQQLVYFNRDTSTVIYVLGIILFFTLFTKIISSYKGKALPIKYLAVIAGIFTLAYPLLSHDVFKYLFSAKMVLEYGANPHVVSPDAFQGDTWLRFMRWINTPSPYGPVFTLITIPSYVLGLGKFVPTLFIFKFTQLAWYALSVSLIGKISKKLGFGSSESRINQMFFALHPTVLIEGLSNAHNDLPMMALFLLAFFTMLSKNYFKSALSLALSVGVKYVTIALAPFYFLIGKIGKDRTIDFLALTFVLAPIIHYSQYQPWYLMWFITMAALSKRKWVRTLAVVYPLGAFFRYIPFVNTNLWSATRMEFALLTFSLPVAYLAIVLTRRVISPKT